MNNFAYLDLQMPLLKQTTDIFLYKNTRHYDILKYENFLSDELLEKLSSINVKPKFLMEISSKTRYGGTESTTIHTDITRDHTDPSGWKKLICAINWEVFDATSYFTWWDMQGVKEVYPNTETVKSEDEELINGIHYETRYSVGSRGGKCLQQARLLNPTLVRTNLPHTVGFFTERTKRVALSIRFHETWNTWEEAVEIFKPLFK